LPLGNIRDFGGGVLTFTDSIPWVSIFFKTLSPILPETFQFFGIYIFACFILQGILSGLTLSLFSKDKLLVNCGVILFGLSPIMIERAFRHTALASHWLILFSLYLLIKSRRDKKMSMFYCLVAVLSIGIHPYFLLMVFAIMATNVTEIAFNSRKFLPNAIRIFVISLLATIFTGYLIGALGTSSSLGGSGYGYYSMNLNALVNPVSCGNIVWSKMVNVLPQILGNYDGFNYLGAGTILLLLVCFLLGISRMRASFLFIKRNISVILLGIGLFIFALSNVVTFNDKIIIKYSLPKLILDFASIFRSSSRMFYPAYYMLMILGIYGVSKLSNDRLRRIIICIAVVVQIIDISPALITKHKSLLNKESVELEYSKSVFSGSDAWMSVAKNANKIKMLSSANAYDYDLAAFGIKYHLSPEVSILSSHYNGASNMQQVYQSNISEVKSNKLVKNAVYVTNDINLVSILAAPSLNTNVYDFGNYFVLASANLNIDAVPLGKEAYSSLRAFNLNDNEWANGISSWGTKDTILFQYSDSLKDVIGSSNYIECNKTQYKIGGVDHNSSWIYVMIGQNATNCSYPNKIKFVSNP
jgi:hypothetical protein